MKDINEDEILFEITYEDLMIVAISLASLNQANIVIISLLAEKITKEESTKKKLLNEITSLEIEMKKRKNIDDHLIPLR
jgi:hypothetical protein